MKRSSVPTAVLVAAVALVALLVYGVVQQQHKTATPSIDRAVAEGKRPMGPKLGLERPTLDGAGQRTLASYKGKVVVVNFFASWCVPCADEAPVLNKTQAALAAAGDGTIVGVATQDAPAAALGFARRYRVAFPLLSDPGEKLTAAYGSHQVPETIVLDTRGRIVDVRRGPVDEAFLTQAIAKARAA